VQDIFVSCLNLNPTPKEEEEEGGGKKRKPHFLHQA
jgi:hypothetical protein